MSLWKIALRSIEQRRVASALTIFSMALGVALVVVVLVVYGVVDRTFRNTAGGYEMVVGGKGGRLDLVLNAVYHMGPPIEPIPWAFFKEFKPGGRYADYTSSAVPYCIGDSFEGHRIVATTPDMFDIEYMAGRPYEFAAGRNFGKEAALAAGEKVPEKKPFAIPLDDDDNAAAEGEHHHHHAAPPFFNEAVVGALAARETGLAVGDAFEPTHGVTTEGELGHKHDPVKVVGVLKPTGTPNDRAIFMNIEGFFLLDGHSKSGEHHHDGPLPEEEREVTAILVRTNPDNVMAPMLLTKHINEGQAAQAVSPVAEIRKLLDTMIRPVTLLLVLVAAMIVVVAGIGIIVSIYNSMNERRREIAVMRSLGASRSSIVSIVMLESLLLALAGGVCGFLLGHALIAAAGPYLLDRTGVEVGFLQFPTVEIPLNNLTFQKLTGALVVPIELVLLPGLVLLAGIVGYFPAVAAYRTDVSRALSNAT
jgi:putative ABC transport system permease protein